MPRPLLGVICGLVYGALSAASMIPLSFPDKRAALTAAFLDRFAIGFLACVVSLPWPGWTIGLLVGILVSLPSAVVTKTYAPIIGIGAVGGAIVGIIAQKFGR